MKIKKRDFLIAIIIVVMPFAANKTSSTIDELLAIVCAFYLFYSAMCHNLDKNETIIVSLMIAIVMMGLLSNVCNKIVTDWFVITVDAVEFIKAISVFLGFRIYFRSKGDLYDISRLLKNISVIIIASACICAIISQFYDMGMTMVDGHNQLYKEYGLYPFGFIFRNGIQTYYLLSGCLIFVLIGERKKRRRNIVLSMYLLTIFLTAKTLTWAGLILYFFFSFYFKKKKSISPGFLLLLAFIILIFAIPSIQVYILDSRAPRSVLLKYGFYTANQCFPFGSGLGTYGGEMAARYYSPLYWKYGFNDRYGLSHEGYGGILNDNYIAMVVAQFGYFGLLLFFIVYYRIWLIFDTSKMNKTIRPFVISVFGLIVCSLIISANHKTLLGVWIHAIMGMCSSTVDISSGKENIKNSTSNSNKIRLNTSIG